MCLVKEIILKNEKNFNNVLSISLSLLLIVIISTALTCLAVNRLGWAVKIASNYTMTLKQ